MQVSTTIEENAHNAPAWSSRAKSSPPTIATVLEISFNPLSRRAGSIAPPLGPPGRAGVEHWYGAVRCVSVDPVLSGCVIQIGGVQYAPRWL